MGQQNTLRRCSLIRPPVKTRWPVNTLCSLLKKELMKINIWTGIMSSVQMWLVLPRKFPSMWPKMSGRPDWNFSSSSIQQALAHALGTRIGSNLYVFNYYDSVLETIRKDPGIDFSRQSYIIHEIMTLQTATKKGWRRRICYGRFFTF